MREPVRNKKEMYPRLAAGEFGNTMPAWIDFEKWKSEGFPKYELWGLRHTRIAGFPGAKLMVSRHEVPRWLEANFKWRDWQLSPMTDNIGTVQWEGDVWRHPCGKLSCSGNVLPAPGTWRKHMLTPRLWEGSAAVALLDHVLNDNSRDDLDVLLETFPDHVVEFSALDVCFGTVPGRNAIVWEVRSY